MTRAIVRTVNEATIFVQSQRDRFDGKAYTLELKIFRQSKTNDQNRLLHAIIAELGEFLGYSPPQMKDILKAMHGSMVTFELNGKSVTIPKSIADYSTTEISDLIDRVYMVGAEMGHIFQEPNQR